MTRPKQPNKKQAISRNIILKYTGERVVPNMMSRDVINWQLHLNRYVFALKYIVGKKVLDAACGTGYGTSLMSSSAKSVEGFDVDKKTIQWAKANNFFYSPVRFMIIDLEKDNIIGKYDRVVSFETIEHLNEPEFFIRNLQKCIHKDGVFIFSVPLNEPLNPLHKRSYTWKSIEKLISINFSQNTKWYSQKIHGIIPGRKRGALFAIGVSYKHTPTVMETFCCEGVNWMKYLKRKVKESIGLTSRSRW